MRSSAAFQAAPAFGGAHVYSCWRRGVEPKSPGKIYCPVHPRTPRPSKREGEP